MKNSGHRVLTINGGSSSIKFAVFKAGGSLERIVQGRIERIGLANSKFKAKGLNAADTFDRTVNVPTYDAAVEVLMDWLVTRADGDVAAVGHRIVHGGPRFWEPQRVSPEMIEELRRLSPFDPEHLPGEISLIEAFAGRFPNVPQIACFDTAFHHDLPTVARTLPIPRRYAAEGVRRYGFHGISCAYLMQALRQAAGEEAARGRVVLAHLGNGASITAVRDGRSVDTSMGFTPTAGLVMSTRSGDLDPGLGWYLERTHKLTAKQFHEMVNNESGLLGVSESSSDMRELVAREGSDSRAGEAVALFCYQVKKWIGAFAAALGGLDTLVFSGGIGENAAEVRERICAGLEFLGIQFDPRANAGHSAVISGSESRVAVRVIPTDEELMIARMVTQVVDIAEKKVLV